MSWTISAESDHHLARLLSKVIGLAYCYFLCHLIKSYLGRLIAANYMRESSHRFAFTIYRAEHMAVRISWNGSYSKGYYADKSQFPQPLLGAVPFLVS